MVLEVLGSIPADRLIWFSKMFPFIQSEAKNSLSPTISIYSAIYNISGEIWRIQLNISEKINQ